jgi:hypothetical protein
MAKIVAVRSSALVCLRFVYFLVIRSFAAARSVGRGDDSKTIGILLLRRQVAVLQRLLTATGKRPKLNWADRGDRAAPQTHPEGAPREAASVGGGSDEALLGTGLCWVRSQGGAQVKSVSLVAASGVVVLDVLG